MISDGSNVVTPAEPGWVLMTLAPGDSSYPVIAWVPRNHWPSDTGPREQNLWPVALVDDCPVPRAVSPQEMTDRDWTLEYAAPVATDRVRNQEQP